MNTLPVILLIIIVAMGFRIFSLQTSVERLLEIRSKLDDLEYPKKSDVTDSWHVGGLEVLRAENGLIYVAQYRKRFTEQEFRATGRYFMKIVDDIERDRALISEGPSPLHDTYEKR
jgi:hypothetical protein